MQNVSVRDANIYTYNKDPTDTVIIKTWMGEQVPQDNYKSNGKPRDGGWYAPGTLIAGNHTDLNKGNREQYSIRELSR